MSYAVVRNPCREQPVSFQRFLAELVERSRVARVALQLLGKTFEFYFKFDIAPRQVAVYVCQAEIACDVVSGKTVLMKCIVGLMQPDKGQVIYDGRDITSMSASQIKELRNEIGMLFQGSALFDSVGITCRIEQTDAESRCKGYYPQL